MVGLLSFLFVMSFGAINNAEATCVDCGENAYTQQVPSMSVDYVVNGISQMNTSFYGEILIIGTEPGEREYQCRIWPHKTTFPVNASQNVLIDNGYDFLDFKIWETGGNEFNQVAYTGNSYADYHGLESQYEMNLDHNDMVDRPICFYPLYPNTSVRIDIKIANLNNILQYFTILGETDQGMCNTAQAGFNTNPAQITYHGPNGPVQLTSLDGNVEFGNGSIVSKNVPYVDQGGSTLVESLGMNYRARVDLPRIGEPVLRKLNAGQQCMTVNCHSEALHHACIILDCTQGWITFTPTKIGDPVFVCGNTWKQYYRMDYAGKVAYDYGYYNLNPNACNTEVCGFDFDQNNTTYVDVIGVTNGNPLGLNHLRDALNSIPCPTGNGTGQVFDKNFLPDGRCRYHIDMCGTTYYAVVGENLSEIFAADFDNGYGGKYLTETVTCGIRVCRIYWDTSLGQYKTEWIEQKEPSYTYTNSSGSLIGVWEYSWGCDDELYYIPCGPCTSNGGDADGDGICADVDCNDNDPNLGLDRDGDGVYDCYDCNDNNSSMPNNDHDCDGILTSNDCNDNDSTILYGPGSSCNDGNSNTTNDMYDSNCICVGTPVVQPCNFTPNAQVTLNSNCYSSRVNISPTGNYSYSWSTSSGVTSNTSVADIYNDGTHSVTVTDNSNSNCSKVVNFIVENFGFEVTPTGDHVECGSVGTGRVQIDPPTGRLYEFRWSNGHVSQSTTESALGLNPGTYSVTVSDIDCTCERVTSVIITCSTSNPCIGFAATATSTSSTCGQANGGASVTSITGGTAPFTYKWSSGDITQSITGQTVHPSGSAYNVTVTDAEGCVTVANTAIYNDNSNCPCDSDIIPSATAINSTCGDPNGGVSLTVTGGTQPYEYLWSNGSTDPNLSGIVGQMPNGTSFNVTVTDDEGCTAVSNTAYVYNSDAGCNPCDNSNLTPGTTLLIADFCEQGGAAEAYGIGGVAPYTYLWGYNNTTTARLDAPAGDYRVTITDATGCQQVTEINIPEFEGIEEVDDSAVTANYCGSGGSANLEVIGGEAPYTIEWSDINLNNQFSVSGLTDSIYTYIVEDARGCQHIGSLSVDEVWNTITIDDDNVINPSCNEDGYVELVANGGQAPYTANWEDFSSSNLSQTLTEGGWYNVTVSDVNGCTSSAIVKVEDANTTPTPTYGVIDDCNISYINIDQLSGIQTVVYNTAGDIVGQGDQVAVTTNDTYTIEYTDGDCSNSIEVTIEIQTLENPEVIFDVISCSSEGTIEVDADIDALIYINGDFVASGNFFGEFSSGEYIIEVRKGDCTYSETAFIADQLTVTSQVVDEICNAGTKGSITLDANLDFDFEVVNGPSGYTVNGNTIKGVSGSYEIRAFTDDGCEEIIFAEINCSDGCRVWYDYNNDCIRIYHQANKLDKDKMITISVYNDSNNLVLSTTERTDMNGNIDVCIPFSESMGIYTVVVKDAIDNSWRVTRILVN